MSRLVASVFLVALVGLTFLAALPSASAAPSGPECVESGSTDACVWSKDETWHACELTGDGGIRGCDTWKGRYTALWIQDHGMGIYQTFAAGERSSWRDAEEGSCAGREEGEGVYASGYGDQVLTWAIQGEPGRSLTEAGFYAEAMRHERTDCDGETRERYSVYVGQHFFARSSLLEGSEGERSYVDVQWTPGEECAVRVTSGGVLDGADREVGC